MHVLLTCVKEKWEKIKEKFRSFSSWLSGIFETDWTKRFGIFGNVLNTFFQTVQEIWGDIQDVFSGIINFVVGTFTGDWERAWQGVQDIFGGIFNGLVDLVKTPFNAIIDMINALIGKINSFLDMVSSALTFEIGVTNPFTGNKVGYKHTTNLGHIGTIPHLAQGGFIGKNTPRLAMIGDNRHYGEIVSPEDKLQEMAMNAAKAVAGTSGVSKEELESIINQAVMRIVAALADMGFYLDSMQVATSVRNANQSMDIRFNSVEVV